MNPKHYLGKICKHHPDGEGLRYKSSLECVFCKQEYLKSPEGRDARAKYNKSPKGRSAQAKYAKTPEGRDAHAKYAKSPKGRKRRSEYNKSPEGRDARAKYNKTPKVRKRNAEYDAKYNKTPQGRALKSAITARRNATKLQATPKWANHDLIADFYRLADAYRRAGVPCEVDHMHPLRSEDVCGLHYEANLRLLSVSDNRRKGNKYDRFLGVNYE